MREMKLIYKQGITYGEEVLQNSTTSISGVVIASKNLKRRTTKYGNHPPPNSFCPY